MRLYRFTAKWCGPCKTLEAKLLKMNMNITAYDVDDKNNAELIKRFGIRSIPAVVMERTNGEFKILVGTDINTQKLKEYQTSKDVT